MLLPSVFRESLFDNFLEDFAFPTFGNTEKQLYGKQGKNLMKTDVKETETGYVVDIDLAGFKKDEIKMQLDHGYLTVSASKGVENGEKDQEGNYVRRERYTGSMSRSFYVGEHVTEKDVHPKYENGILTFELPREEKKPVEEKSRYIAIEG